MKKCKDCYYYDLCADRKMCCHYDPSDNADVYEDDVIELYLEKEKAEYIYAWNRYILQYEFD